MENRIKKKIELQDSHIKYLSELPESGMGYQVVDITFRDGKKLRNRIVVNSQFLLIEDHENIDPLQIEEIELKK